MRSGRSTIAVILAGGEGRRFGGNDKSLVCLAGKPLLAHVIERIAPQVSEVVLNAARDAGRFRGFGLKVVNDQPRSTPATGPLIGLTSTFSALHQAGDVTSDVLSVPVDTPFLPSDLVARLAAALAHRPNAVAYAATTLRDHPIIALWTPDVRDPVCAVFRRQPDISLHGMMQQLPSARVIFDHTSSIDPFFNVNTPDDLRLAEEIVPCPG